LLDLFCGGGGASVGYFRAGFDVVGVDKAPQPFYPFQFIQADALSLDYDFLMSFDAIHASPPCQAYSVGSALARKRGKLYPDLFKPVHRMLTAVGLPYIIENVQGSPAQGIGLCGTMFGLGVKRHRLFQSNVSLILPSTPCTCSSHPGEFITVAGSSFSKVEAKAAMGIDWPIDNFQLKEAIPPAYTQFIGAQLLNYINEKLAIFVSETENPGYSVCDRRLLSVSGNDETLVLSVSEVRENFVSGNDEQQLLTVSEHRGLPVVWRCHDCGEPLTVGTARRKYCNSRCRLRAFRRNVIISPEPTLQAALEGGVV
jgi:DNA (cytosine-5)-methyltransferase 1